jgi:hypothetical protein
LSDLRNIPPDSTPSDLRRDPRTLVVAIDDEIETLIQEINEQPNAAEQTQFVQAFHNMLVDQLMGPFGLTRAMFDDRDGGAITTVHNFEQGVVANDADAQRHANWEQARQNNFERKDYDAALDREHPTMQSPDGGFYDGYTGQELPQGPRTTARDHVVAASAIERSAKGHLGQTREQRVETATHEDNVVLTGFGMNASKSDSDLLEWAARPNTKEPDKTNAEYYGVEQAQLEAVHQRATQRVQAEQNRAVLVKQAGELLTEGAASAGKLALRQVLGLVLKDLIGGVVADIRHLMREGYESASQLTDVAHNRLLETWARIKLRWSEYLKEGVSAGLSGFLGTLVTLLINAFVTTAKNLVRMIREGVMSFVRAIRIIVSPPPGATGAEIAFEVVKLLSGALVTCVGIALEEAIAKGMQAVAFLAPIAAEVAPVIAGVLTGTMTLLTVLAFDRLKQHIAFENQQLSNVHRAQKVSFLRGQRIALALHSAHEHLDRAREAQQSRADATRREVEQDRRTTQRSVTSYRQAVDDLEELMEGV